MFHHRASKTVRPAVQPDLHVWQGRSPLRWLLVTLWDWQMTQMLPTVPCNAMNLAHIQMGPGFKGIILPCPTLPPQGGGGCCLQAQGYDSQPLPAPICCHNPFPPRHKKDEAERQWVPQKSISRSKTVLFTLGKGTAMLCHRMQLCLQCLMAVIWPHGAWRNAGHLRHQILHSNGTAGWLSRENVTIQTVIWPAQWI